MDTSQLKKFAQYARRFLIEQITAKMSFVLKETSAARRENEKAVTELEKQIHRTSKEQVVEKVAYIWFNRFCALRFMDVNRYTRIGTVSPAEGHIQPEILAEAKQGHIDFKVDRQKVFDLLGNRTPSHDPQQEAYRLLLVAVCNYYNEIMPFMFERIADYTELLLPDDLLSGTSILAYTREALYPEACENVEVIGWLYQFYISEKKDEVFAKLKKGKKITPENIPAATQLFTPNWIVRYLVENSLGRLWMLNRPESRLVEKMDYYIRPEQPETDFLRVSSPEEIKICDPACGSGHMLVYAFDLLYAIYEEEGYDVPEIPRLILKNNLYGIEIDERAGELAAFALVMKAREKYRGVFRKPVQPNICVLENIKFEKYELDPYIDEMGHKLFNLDLHTTLRQFEETDNFGSLIRPAATNVTEVLSILEKKDVVGLLRLMHKRVLKVLRQADYLSPKYHVVIANPPYMGGKGMNPILKSFLHDNYRDVKSDLFSAFIMRNLELTLAKGYLGFVTPFVWMFISSYEKLRKQILSENTISNLVQLEYNAFAPACIPVCSFTVIKDRNEDYKGNFIKLSEFRGAENQAPRALEAIRNHDCGWFYQASASDFKKIPGSPISYSISPSLRQIFAKYKSVEYFAKTASGLQTNDNSRFIRYWFEVPFNQIGFNCCSRAESVISQKKWFPHAKGGSYRKWYGNIDYVVNWENDGSEIMKLASQLYGSPTRTVKNLDLYFKDGLTWTDVSSSSFGVRRLPPGFIFDTSAPSLFSNQWRFLLGYLLSPIVVRLLKVLSPCMHFLAGDIAALPFFSSEVTFSENPINLIVDKTIACTKKDYEYFETSWDFADFPLLQNEFRQETLAETYISSRKNWREMTLEMQRLEEENNRIFIDAYGLQDELTPDVPLKEITLTCNPHYRYGKKKSEEELEALLLADTMKEFVSYAVGCMFGRYSLDKPGLILANQGERLEDYLRQVPEPTFEPDDDNVIPLMDVDWFTDDITERLRKFLRVTFGEEHYEENLGFIENAIGKDIRKYFLRDFYNDHVKRYKKRPIYWMFSSPKGSFNALIYMHRYRPDTVSVVLNDYLREFRTKLLARKDHLGLISISASASQSEKTKALKEIETLKKIIDELETWEREILYPLATKQLEIDLDDGVKVNYPKFGLALKKIPGL